MVYPSLCTLKLTSEDESVCELLLRTSLNSVQNGATALHMASQEAYSDVARMLVDAKADVNIKNSVSESCCSDCVCILAKLKSIND